MHHTKKELQIKQVPSSSNYKYLWKDYNLYVNLTNRKNVHEKKIFVKAIHFKKKIQGKQVLRNKLNIYNKLFDYNSIVKYLKYFSH